MECYLNETTIYMVHTKDPGFVYMGKKSKRKSKKIGFCRVGCFDHLLLGKFLGNFEKLRQVLNSTSGGHLHRQPTLGALACSGRGPRLPGWMPQDKILLRGMPSNSCRSAQVLQRFTKVRYMWQFDAVLNSLGCTVPTKEARSQTGSWGLWWTPIPPVHNVSVHKIECMLTGNHWRQCRQ